MNLWTLELRRLTRTRRWLALVGIYLFFGLTGPFLAKYLGQLLGAFGGGIEVAIPDPVPSDGLANYVSNASQIGLLIAAWVAASALTLDSIPQMGTFLRTRVDRMARLMMPRYVVATAAIIGAYILGSAGALYESTFLLGSVPFDAWAIGTLLGALYLAFAVALVAVLGRVMNSVVAVVVSSIGVLLILPALGLIAPLAKWLPSHLVGALSTLTAGTAEMGEYWPAIGVTAIVTALLLLVASWGTGRKR